MSIFKVLPSVSTVLSSSTTDVDPDPDPDHLHNLISCFLYQNLQIPKVLKPIHNFLILLTGRHTEKDTHQPLRYILKYQVQLLYKKQNLNLQDIFMAGDAKLFIFQQFW